MVVDTTLYDLLDVQPNATSGELRKAYHKKSLACHPDKKPAEQQEEASKEFQRINHAFEVLSDDDQRALYDSVGEDGMRPGAGASAAGGEDLDDLFASMFGAGAGMDGMGGGFGQGPQPKRSRPKRRRAPPTILNYAVTLSDLYLGRKAHFQLTHDIFCPLCQGTGAKHGLKANECVECKGTGAQQKLASMGNGFVRTMYVDCTACKGAGSRVRERDRCKKCKGAQVVKAKDKLDVDIQQGMRDGQKLFFRERGDAVAGCQRPGHLIMLLKLHAHPDLEVCNNDLCTTSSITLSEALLGIQRTVFTHLDGRSIRIASKKGQVIRPGDVCVIRGQGLPGHKGARTGDLYIKWNIEFPPDDWLSQIDALKLSSLLPPKRADPARDYAKVNGKMDQSSNSPNNNANPTQEEQAETNFNGLGHVQDLELVVGRLDEFGSHALPPLEEEEESEDEDQGGARGCVIC